MLHNLKDSQDTVLFVCPVRNEAKGIRAMLDSLSHQSHKNWRLIVSDNASTDDTPLIVKQYARSDPRIRLVEFSHAVPIHESFARSFNEAEVEKAEFVQIIAGDDALGSNDYLEIALGSMRNLHFDAVIGGVLHFSDHSDINVDYFDQLKGKSSLWTEKFVGRNYWICNLMYGFFRREAFFRLISIDEHTFSNNLSSDWWFALGVVRRLNLGHSRQLIYRKYSKQLSYQDKHYGLSTRRPMRLLSPLLFPLSQLGDRVRLIPVAKSLVWLSRFYLREIRGIFRSLNQGTKRSVS